MPQSLSKLFVHLVFHIKNQKITRGYAAFSVSPSLHHKTRDYIMNQENHHKKMTFKEELVLFLKEYGIDYNEKFLWED